MATEVWHLSLNVLLTSLYKTLCSTTLVLGKTMKESLVFEVYLCEQKLYRKVMLCLVVWDIGL